MRSISKGLKMHSSSLRPRYIKLQSPPYPITAAEDVINAEWNDASVELVRLVERYSNLESSTFAVDVPYLNLRSIVIDLPPEEAGIESSTFNSDIARLELISVVVEYQTDFNDDSTTFAVGIGSLAVTKVVVPYSTNFNDDSTTFTTTISRLELL